MNAQQKIKHLILNRLADWDEIPCPTVTVANVDELFDAVDEPQDAMNDVRCGEVETGLPSPSSRHYEAKEVAAKAPDGSWVGWTYWYGGGKHGEPESVEWIEYAYDLTCVEEEKRVVVQTFTKATGGQP